MNLSQKDSSSQQEDLDKEEKQRDQFDSFLRNYFAVMFYFQSLLIGFYWVEHFPIKTFDLAILIFFGVLYIRTGKTKLCLHIETSTELPTDKQD